MNPLCGRRDTVESLQGDIANLQSAILDVFSRTGPVRFPSWKFPEKLSCLVDVVALLEQYNFKDGQDAFNQNSHMVLLELVIDRLLLLLQSFSVYIEQLRINHRRGNTPQTAHVSVGLVVRHCWSNLVELASQKAICNYIEKDTKTNTCDCETESGSQFYPSASSSSSSIKRRDSLLSSIPFSSKVVSCNIHNVSCQTVELPPLPCAACARLQSILKQTGDGLLELFQSEGLPCSLEALLGAVKDTVELGHMTEDDVAQWTSEQCKDMKRLAKHIKEVRGTVKPLKQRLAEVETQCEQFRSRLDRAQAELKQEMAKHQASTALLERSRQETQRSMKEEQRLREANQQLKTETLSLEARNTRLKEELAERHKRLHTLESEKKSLQEEVKTLRVKEETCYELEEKIQQLDNQISQTQVLLNIERAKYHSACRQQESMQVKQRCLLERVDTLDQEYEELQRQLGESEEQETHLQNQLKRTSEEKKQLQAQIVEQQALYSDLQKEKQNCVELETQVDQLKKSLAELKEDGKTLRQRERLLVAFPELSARIHGQPQSTGDVLLDMEQQLQANCIRITILEQENTNLRHSLMKLRERAQSYADMETLPQTWGHSLPSTPTEDQQDHVKHIQRRTMLSSSSPRSEGKKTLRLSTEPTALKGKMKSRSASQLPCSRAPNPRKMWNL
ncbi:coiled-coil domain-containing protein 157 [Genypterus blacodes]|uniref:coiled-coil domain-containing protein 157 n=1 Tax=Genypterus blacodes TaxID=154954 RepID=UPI003F75DFAF